MIRDFLVGAVDGLDVRLILAPGVQETERTKIQRKARASIYTQTGDGKIRITSGVGATVTLEHSAGAETRV